MFDRPTSPGMLLMGLSVRRAVAGATVEQHQIRKHHAIVHGWLMEEALLDYPLVEELIESVSRPRRSEPQPAVTHYRSSWRQWRCRWRLALTPSARYGLVELEPKNMAADQLRRHLAHLVIRSLATASTAICGKTAPWYSAVRT